MLTPTGRELIARVIAGHRAWVHAIMAGLSGQELSDLHSLLQQLSKHLETIGPETAGAE